MRPANSPGKQQAKYRIAVCVRWRQMQRVAPHTPTKNQMQQNKQTQQQQKKAATWERIWAYI